MPDEFLERAAWANGIIPLQDTIAEQIERQLLPDFEPENPRDCQDCGADISGGHLECIACGRKLCSKCRDEHRRTNGGR